MGENNYQDNLRDDYHKYLEIASRLPEEMKKRGVFETMDIGIIYNQIWLNFSSDGNINLTKRARFGREISNKIPVTALNEIIYQGFNYELKPLDLSMVKPSDMNKLRKIIENAERSLESKNFYLKKE